MNTTFHHLTRNLNSQVQLLNQVVNCQLYQLILERIGVAQDKTMQQVVINIMR
jgi:hypothetical protein